MGWFKAVLEKMRKFLVIEPESSDASPGATPETSDTLEPPPAEAVIQYLNAQAPIDQVPPMKMGVLRELANKFERPTHHQVEAFIDHVASAGSWYKHLPMTPPGTDFQFFFDPFAGMDHVLSAHGNVVHLPRHEGTPRLHYTWMPTDEYRARFGLLSFHVAAGSSHLLPIAIQLAPGHRLSGFITHRALRATWQFEENTELRVPDEVLEAGTVRWSGIVHPRAAHHEPWLHAPRRPSSPDDWPEAAGGPELLSRIMNRARELEQQGRGGGDQEHPLAHYDSDPELERLLLPERQRQRAAAIAAVERMLGLLYNPVA